MEARALALWPQLAQAANARDWPRVHPLLDALHEVMASAHDLTPSTREALDVGIPHVLDHLPASRSVFDVSAAAPDERGEPGESCAAASTPAMVPVVGLMITKDDHAVLHEWLEANLRFLDGLVLLDGSEGSASREIVDRFRDASPRGLRLHYMHESSSPGLDRAKTDQTLRRVVHRRIRAIFGSGVWLMLCHPDEFFYHDPRAVAAAAQAEGADHVFWWALHVLPHPSERAAYEAGGVESALVQRRFRHFHHSFEGGGRPFLEGRLFRDGRGVEYGHAHFQTLPAHGLRAPWRRLGAEWLSTLTPTPTLTRTLTLTQVTLTLTLTLILTLP